MKRVLSLLLAIALMGQMLAFPASAEETESRYVVIDELTQSATLVVEPAVDPNAVAMLAEGPSFATLEEAVAAAQAIPEEEGRPAVLVLKDCEITQPIPITNGLVNIFPSEFGVPRTITSSAETAFEISNGASLVINDLDVTTNSGKYIFNITGGASGMLLGGGVGCNISGVTEAAIHVSEGVLPRENEANVAIYSTSISGAAVLELNGSNTRVDIVSSGTFAATGDEGVFVVNGDGHCVAVQMAHLTGSSAYALNGDSMIRFAGVSFNGEGKYNDPHNAPYALPGTGAAARVDTGYYGSLAAALDAAAELQYEDNNAVTPLTILQDVPVEEDLTISAKHPIKLNLTGHTLTVEGDASLTLAKQTELWNGTILACYGAQLSGEDVTPCENGKLLRQVALTALVDGNAEATVKAGTVPAVTVTAKTGPEKTVEDIAVTYTIIPGENTPAADTVEQAAQNPGTYTIKPTLEASEGRYVVAEELTKDGVLTVEGEVIGTIDKGEWKMELDSVIFMNYYPTIEGFPDDFDFANRGGVVVWVGEENPTGKDDLMHGKANTITLEGMKWNETTEKWYVQTPEIFAKNIGDIVYIRPYVKTADGEYVYMTSAVGHSPARFCYDVMDVLSEDLQKRHVCAALLEYGASAQVYFNHKVDSLVNKIPNGWPNIKWSDYSLEYSDAYLDDLDVPANAADLVKTMTGVNNKTVVKGGQTLDLQGAIRMSVGFNLDLKEEDIVNAKVMFWSEDDIKNVTSLAYEDGTYTDICDLTEAVDGEIDLGKYRAKSHHILPKNLSDTVYYYCMVEMADDSVYRSGLIVYSPEMCVSDHLSDNTTGQVDIVAQRIAVYSEMALRYFGNN